MDGITILVVDDNPINIMVAKNLLEKWGYSVDTALDGQEALELFSVYKYQCILMDIHMPNMSGIEASLAIRKIEKQENATQIPIIAFTADTFLDERTLVEPKIETKLLKPFQPEELKTLLEILVRS